MLHKQLDSLTLMKQKKWILPSIHFQHRIFAWGFFFFKSPLKNLNFRGCKQLSKITEVIFRWLEHKFLPCLVQRKLSAEETEGEDLCVRERVGERERSDNRDRKGKAWLLFHPHKSPPALHFKQSAVHYVVWDGHDWLILSPCTLEGPLPENVSSSPAINLISLNKSIHYPGCGIDRQGQSVYWWIIKYRKIMIGPRMFHSLQSCNVTGHRFSLVTFLPRRTFSLQPGLISITHSWAEAARSPHK